MLHLSDGPSFCVSAESLQAAGVGAHELSPGTELERGRAERLRDCSRSLETRRKALDLLARRSHSQRELELKLAQRGFSAIHVQRAMAWLAERGYLDDRGFAREWVERRVARHPEGRPALVAGLRRRGVSREIAEEVVAAECSADAERAAARAALARLMRRGGGGAGDADAEEGRGDADGLEAAEVERLRRALRRRGFSSSVVLELLPGRRLRRLDNGEAEGDGPGDSRAGGSPSG
ncbi:MAG: regulatory protein RecX [Spirochaetales bacterium]|nr:regulatory protein RecX [Spirochaetales bacterium]